MITDDDLEAIKTAKDKVSAAITTNEGDPWPFNVWEAWQGLEKAITAAEDHAEDLRYEAMNEYPHD